VDALYEKILNLPSHLTMAHEMLDLVKYTRSLDEQLETLREALRWIEANEAGEPHAAAIAHDALNPASDYEQASLDTFGADSAPASRRHG
jgi:hypothetical protein